MPLAVRFNLTCFLGQAQPGISWTGEYRQMSRESEIREFAGRFEGRLESSLVEQALDYLQYNENGLALEILCEHLFEYDVPLTATECAAAECLAAEMSIECNAIKRLRELVK